MRNTSSATEVKTKMQEEAEVRVPKREANSPADGPHLATSIFHHSHRPEEIPQTSTAEHFRAFSCRHRKPDDRRTPEDPFDRSVRWITEREPKHHGARRARRAAGGGGKRGC